ncbi:MAG: hypothetical protein NTX52_07080, partial [Planctomycetota bacterium]|nr:hypothetical protein [Planctomycetota bacterium]
SAFCPLSSFRPPPSLKSSSQKTCSKHDYFLQKDAKRRSFLTKKRKKRQFSPSFSAQKQISPIKSHLLLSPTTPFFKISLKNTLFFDFLSFFLPMLLKFPPPINHAAI